MIFQPRFGPSYTIPFFVTLGMVGISFMGYAFFRVLISSENKRRESLLDQWTKTQVQAELARGTGPSAYSRGAYFLTFATQYTNNPSIKRVQKKMKEAGRRGDERITFRYGL